jgi:predicted permease
MLQDLRYALRQLRKNPGFALTAIIALALGIGANAAMFTVVRGVLLAPLPYDHSERIVDISAPHGVDGVMRGISFPDLRDWQAQSKSFEQIAFWMGGGPRSLEGTTGRWQVTVQQGTWNLLQVFGVQPKLGRLFRADEGQPGKRGVVVLGADTWKSAFNADPNVAGKSIRIWGKPYTVAGVMPDGFSHPLGSRMEVWIPDDESPEIIQARDKEWWDPIGRMRPGVELAQAQAELTSIQGNIAKQYADQRLADHVRLENYRETLVKNVRAGIWALTGAVFVVWLIACVNVANLLLTRTIKRRHEVAIRGALGAGRTALVRQFLTEALLLCVLGGLCGLSLAVVALKLMWTSIDRTLPLTYMIHFDATVLAGLFGLSLISTLLIGSAAAIKVATVPVQDGLRDHAISGDCSDKQRWLRDGLVVAQISLTLVLLVAGGLLMRTVYALRHVPLGFREENVVTGSLVFPPGVYEKNNISAALFEPLLNRLRALPGVKSAAISSVVPMRGEVRVTVQMPIVGRPELPPDQRPHAEMRIASPLMAETLGIRMLRGRFFSEGDTVGAPEVAVINDAYARQYFGQENPLGHQFSMGGQTLTIVGVIDDLKQTSLERPTSPEIYICSQQITPGSAFYGVATAFIQLAVRTQLAPEAMVAQIQTVIRQAAPDATINKVKTMHEVVEDSIGSQTLAARLIGVFSAIALLIAVVGLYGLLAYTVSQRTREIGVRIALGASRENVLGLVLHRAVRLLGIGLGFGLAGAWFAGRVLRSFLFGVGAHDSVTIAMVSLLLFACGISAAYLPASRAAAIDPMTALRTE